MSLKGGLSDTKIRNAIANNKLHEYVNKGIISKEKYNRLLELYGSVPCISKEKGKTQKIKHILCSIILILSLVAVAVIYHHNAIDNAYEYGRSIGYKEGQSKGYSDGYDKGYAFYEEIEDEYQFYHKSAVLVTKTGERYHRYDCYHVKNRPLKIFNIENAKVKGYTPCLDCFD